MGVAMATSMLQSLSRMNVHATLGDGEMLVLKTSLEYGEGQPVEIRVRRRGNRFDIDDGRGAIELAGRPPGWIEAAHGVVEELGILTKEVRARKMGHDLALGSEGGTAGPSPSAQPTAAPSAGSTPLAAASAMTEKPPVVPARLAGLDLGPACQQCGGMMRRTGSCYTCPSCGNNTGCG